MRLSTIALAVATMSSMARAQVDPGVVDICISNVCEPYYTNLAECVCENHIDYILGCVARYWSSFPDGIAEIVRAEFVIEEWCSTHYNGTDAA